MTAIRSSLFVWIAALAVMAGAACLALAVYSDLWLPKKAATAPPAAGGAKPKTEADLVRLRLTRREVKSLDVRSAPATMAKVQEQLKIHGFVMARPGSEVVLTAPVAGYVRAPTTPENLPVPGRTVQEKAELFRLEPVLSPVEKTQYASTLVQLYTLRRGIEGELAKARDSVDVSKLETKRMTGLVKDKLRGEQDLEQASARLKFAETDLAAAEGKLKIFAENVGQIEKEQSQPLSITAPLTGQVLALNVSPGQFVQASAPLATIADLDAPWLRVAVSEQDLQRIDYHSPATIQIGNPPLTFLAQPVGLVPRVDPLRHTADILYDLGKATAPVGKRPPVYARDQMLTVLLPLDNKRPESVVPASAVVNDYHGSAWVYLEVGGDDKGRVYERRRVDVGARVEQGLVVRPGLSSNDKVVFSGAAALFSREFYRPPVAGKPVADDDD
jgi:multidrug efflux pump subunit AcrA (membrane-fusion protein)